jgi:site-specific DNA recombinase
MKIVGYARVSSREQEREGFSIDAQIDRIQSHADKKGLHIEQMFVEVESAKKSGRPKFDEMLAYLKKNPQVQGILCHKVDRLCRNFKDYVTIDELPISAFFVEEEFANNAAGKLTFAMKVVLAKHYCDNLSDEVKKGMQEKAKQGHYPHKAPYGYRNNKETRLIDVYEEEACFVRRVFDLYATGNFSLNELRNQLHREGFIFKSNQPKIGKSTLDALLNNIFYTGDFIIKEQFFRGKHHPLVSLRLFETVQQVKGRVNRPKMTKHDFAFSGLLICGHCGCSVTPQIQKERYIYYHCSNGKGKCHDKYVREETLAEQFAEAIKGIQVGEEQLQWISAALKESHKDEMEFHRERTQALRQRYDTLEHRVEAIYEDKLDNKIPEELWFRKNEEYKREMAQINDSLLQHEKGNFDYVDCGIRTLELAKNAYQLYSQMNTLEQRQILNVVLSNCTLKGGNVDYTYNPPFDLLTTLPKSEKWSG